MSDRDDLTVTLPWMRAGTAHLVAIVEKLSDAELAQPSALPGWTRAHLVGHVARNAEALTRLAVWARTGVENPMYPSPQARAAEIEESAGFPPARLRAELAGTAADLDDALAALTPQQWQAGVRSALGRPTPATDVPFMRGREVWLHAVDLDAGASVDDLPDGFVDLLLDDVTATLSAKAGCPRVLLAPTDRGRTWALGAQAVTPSSGASAATEPAPFGGEPVTGPAAAIVGWLTGRTPASALPGTPPELPRWL